MNKSVKSRHDILAMFLRQMATRSCAIGAALLSAALPWPTIFLRNMLGNVKKQCGSAAYGKALKGLSSCIVVAGYGYVARARRLFNVPLISVLPMG